LPEGWQRLRLNEVVESSRASRGGLAGADAKIPFIPMALLPNDGLPTTCWEMRSAEEVRSGVPFAEGDVLLAKITPCLENGKLGIASGIPGGWGMTSTEVYPLRGERVTSEFLACFLTLPAVRHSLASKMQGATGRQRLPKEALDAFPIPVPPLPEQRAIAGVLRTVQGAQAACERMLAAARQLKQSLLHHLFTCGPVPFPQAAHVPLKETEIGEIPSHWDVVPLGAGFTVFSGFAFKSQDFTTEGIPVIKIGNLQNGTVVTDKDSSYFPRHLLSQAHERFVLHPGDVLIAMTGATTGKVSTVPASLDGAVLNQRVGKVAPRQDSPFTLDFAKWFIPTQFFQSEIQDNILKSAQGNISPTNIERILMPKPPLEEQQEIARQLGAVDAKLAALASRRAALAALFTSLLHHLLTPRLRLPEFTK
jgi:type I restriction enzyme S subunit